MSPSSSRHVRTRRRRVWAVLIVGTWLATLGWQVRREHFQPDLARLAERAMSLAPGVNFYTLELGGRAVGLASSKLDTVPDGFLLEDFMRLDLPALGQTGTAAARTRVALTPTLQVRDFGFDLQSEVGNFSAEGAVQGDSLLTVEIQAGGEPQQVSYRLSNAPVFAAVLPIRVAAGGELEVGRTLRLPVFDPSTLSTRDVSVEVVEHDTLAVPDSSLVDAATGRWVPATWDSIPAWKIAESYGGVRIESWVDEDGRILRAESPLGFSMVRTEYELARQALAEAEGQEARAVDDDVILSTAVAANVDLGDVERADELRFLLRGVDLEGFQLDGGRQRLVGDTLIVSRESWGQVDPGYQLPYKRMDLAEALQSEPLIQSDDPRIQREARSRAGRGPRRRDPAEVARRLTTAVHEMLDKEITFSVPSALQVLDGRRGDCNEHTVLYVAMARALGLPARTAVGLVYVNGGFFYHAWPEVWLGEWVAVDPTFGQTPADAAHLRFIVGGLAQQVEIVRLIGRLEIDVLTDTDGAVSP